jgi:hypothetical protein
MEAEERLTKAAEYLDQWGQAVRHSWADFDGRSAKIELKYISDFMRGRIDDNPLSGIVCIKGDYGPHWAYFYREDHACE